MGWGLRGGGCRGGMSLWFRNGMGRAYVLVRGKLGEDLSLKVGLVDQTSGRRWYGWCMKT